MIKKFVDAWNKKKHLVEESFRKDEPESYRAIIKAVVSILGADSDDGPDPERVTEIDHGHYSGVLVFVIAEKGYVPEIFWYVRISYGSCSSCDALHAVEMEEDDEKRIAGYMSLALHVLQRLKVMK